VSGPLAGRRVLVTRRWPELMAGLASLAPSPPRRLSSSCARPPTAGPWTWRCAASCDTSGSSSRARTPWRRSPRAWPPSGGSAHRAEPRLRGAGDHAGRAGGLAGARVSVEPAGDFRAAGLVAGLRPPRGERPARPPARLGPGGGDGLARLASVAPSSTASWPIAPSLRTEGSRWPRRCGRGGRRRLRVAVAVEAFAAFAGRTAAACPPRSSAPPRRRRPAPPGSPSSPSPSRPPWRAVTALAQAWR